MDELIATANKLGIEVRVQPMLGPRVGAGGLCRLRGRLVVVIDAEAPAVERAGALADALGQLDTEGVFMPPEVREILDSARERKRWRLQPTRPRSRSERARVRALPVAKPGLRRCKSAGRT